MKPNRIVYIVIPGYEVDLFTVKKKERNFHLIIMMPYTQF